MAVFCDVVLVFWSSIRRLRTRWCSKILIQVASYLYVNYTNRNAILQLQIIGWMHFYLLISQTVALHHFWACTRVYLFVCQFVCQFVCYLLGPDMFCSLFTCYLEGFLLHFILSFHISFSAARIPIDTSGYLLLYI